MFYRCTNCLAYSVLYSRDHKQGFILYCISTHWTIICIRDCKENDTESVGKENIFGAGPLIAGAVDVWEWEKYFQGENAD